MQIKWNLPVGVKIVLFGRLRASLPNTHLYIGDFTDFIVFSIPIKPVLHWCWVSAWTEGVEGKVKAGGARCALWTKVPRVMWHKLQLLNLAPHCFHTRERMVMLIRLDSLRGKKKTLALHTMPSASLNPTREAEVLSRWGGGSCTSPAPAGENPLPCAVGRWKKKAFSLLKLGVKRGMGSACR